MRNAEIWFDAGELNTRELVTFYKHLLPAEPDTASKELNFILNRYIWFGKVSVNLNVVQICCWRWIFWQSPSWHAAKLLVQSRRSCWAWITSVLLQLCAGTVPEKRVSGSREPLSHATLPPAWQGPWQSCPPAAGSVQECPSGHVRILAVVFAICPSVPRFLSWSYTRLDGQGEAQWKG